MSKGGKEENLLERSRSSDEHSYDNLSSPTFDKGSMGDVGTPGSVMDDDDTPVYQDPVEKEKMMLELKEELIKVEGEIATLRQVLGTKVRYASELKRKMGITPFQEFKADMASGIEQIRGSDSYQKTSGMMKTATEKTSSAFSAVGGAMSKKLGDIKNSPTFKSLEEKVEHTYTNVKAKVTGSKSNQELGEELKEETTDGDSIPIQSSKSTPLPEEKIPLN